MRIDITKFPRVLEVDDGSSASRSLRAVRRSFAITRPHGLLESQLRSSP
jgi:hypothetical protein